MKVKMKFIRRLFAEINRLHVSKRLLKDRSKQFWDLAEQRRLALETMEYQNESLRKQNHDLMEALNKEKSREDKTK